MPKNESPVQLAMRSLCGIQLLGCFSWSEGPFLDGSCLDGATNFWVTVLLLGLGCGGDTTFFGSLEPNKPFNRPPPDFLGTFAAVPAVLVVPAALVVAVDKDDEEQEKGVDDGTATPLDFFIFLGIVRPSWSRDA